MLLSRIDVCLSVCVRISYRYYWCSTELKLFITLHIGTHGSLEVKLRNASEWARHFRIEWEYRCTLVCLWHGRIPRLKIWIQILIPKTHTHATFNSSTYCHCIGSIWSLIQNHTIFRSLWPHSRRQVQCSETCTQQKNEGKHTWDMRT